MKPYVIDKNSWHYKFISKGKRWDYLTYSVPKDFCSYWRMVAFKMLSVTFFASMAIIFAIFLGYNIYLDPIPVIGGIFSAVVIIVGVAFIGVMIEKRKEKKRQHDYDVKFKDKQEGLFAMKYRAWKEKTCPMVEYK